jgi:O-acetylserine/cysteine efflux transporter
MALAALVSVVWGLGFPAMKMALEDFTAAQLLALRFLVACVPALWIARPSVPWHAILLVGLTLFAGQFLLLFLAFRIGMPPGLASVTQQTQAFFTVLLAAALLRERPSRREIAGLALGLAGLALIGLTLGGDVSTAALALAIGGAFSWAVGNVAAKRLGAVPMFALVVWCSLVPPLPALLLSALVGEGEALPAAVLQASWASLGAALYLGVFATLVGYALWNDLLRRYPTASVAPFALVAPCVGVVSSALIFGEVFEPERYAGMVLILAGLAVVVLPVRASSVAGTR